MAGIGEVKVFDVKNTKCYSFPSRALNELQDLTLFIRNETGIAKDRQLLLCKGRSLFDKFHPFDVIKHGTVYMFEKDSEELSPFPHDSKVDTVDEPINSDNEVHMRVRREVFSKWLCRSAKNCKDIQEHLKEGERQFREFLQENIKTTSSLLQDYEPVIDHKLKRIDLIRPLLTPPCRDIQGKYTHYCDVKENILKYKEELYVMAEKVKVFKNFKGCQESCCMEKFQRSVSMVEDFNKRLSDLPESSNESQIEHERSHLRNRVRATSELYNTHCQSTLIELNKNVQMEISLHQDKQKTIEEIKNFVKEIKAEDPHLDDIMKQGEAKLQSQCNRNISQTKGQQQTSDDMSTEGDRRVTRPTRKPGVYKVKKEKLLSRR